MGAQVPTQNSKTQGVTEYAELPVAVLFLEILNWRCEWFFKMIMEKCS